MGDWEIDTFISKGHSGALVTIFERVTNSTVSKQVNGKSAAAVTQATLDFLKPLKDVVHTRIFDNGKEFTYHEKISDSLETEFYFAHQYSSWERDLNENTNGLLCQYFPRNTHLKKATQIEVSRAVKRLNVRQKKYLDFKTPADLMAQHKASLAA